MNPYCVILCPEPLVSQASYPRTKCFYLRAPSAEGAIQTALVDNPQSRVIGVEPSHLFVRPARRDPSIPTQHNGHAA
jgi:hypothetical protein